MPTGEHAFGIVVEFPWALHGATARPRAGVEDRFDDYEEAHRRTGPAQAATPGAARLCSANTTRARSRALRLCAQVNVVDARIEHTRRGKAQHDRKFSPSTHD